MDEVVCNVGFVLEVQSWLDQLGVKELEGSGVCLPLADESDYQTLCYVVLWVSLQQKCPPPDSILNRMVLNKQNEFSRFFFKNQLKGSFINVQEIFDQAS